MQSSTSPAKDAAPEALATAEQISVSDATDIIRDNSSVRPRLATSHADASVVSRAVVPAGLGQLPTPLRPLTPTLLAPAMPPDSDAVPCDDSPIEATEPFEWVPLTREEELQAIAAAQARQAGQRAERLQQRHDAGCPSPSTAESYAPTPPRN